MKTIQGNLSTENFRVAIILSRFNKFIGDRLLDGAIACLKQYKCREENIDIVSVPGAFEIPVTAAKLADTKKYDSIICLGAVIRGETPHFDFVAGQAAAGIAKVSLDYKIPVIFGVLTTDNIEQALERAGENPHLENSGTPDASKETGSGNKGWDSALAAIEMADLFSKI